MGLEEEELREDRTRRDYEKGDGPREGGEWRRG